ncbi:hypothetical protein J6590_047806 [Homalodisca vitripennis]|nr:hypothetical protein J6590_047806 [Homalodisca vitripennis]
MNSKLQFDIIPQLARTDDKGFDRSAGNRTIIQRVFHEETNGHLENRQALISDTRHDSLCQLSRWVGAQLPIYTHTWQRRDGQVE